MANEFATPSNTLRRVARRLVNNPVFASRQNCMREYDNEYRVRGAKQGDTVTLRLPQRYEVSIGRVMNATPLTDQTVTLKITDQSNIGFDYDTWAATLYVDDYMERYGAPAIDQLVNNIDSTGLARMYKKVAKSVGAPGVVPANNDPYALAKTKLVEASVPRPYRAVITADMHGTLAKYNQVYFNPAPQLSQFFKTGQIAGPALGIESWFEDENIFTHQVGTLGGTPLVKGGGQFGTQILIDGATANIPNYFRDGDSVSFATCYDINMLSNQSTGRRKDQTVVGNHDSDANGEVLLNISPGIVPVGQGPFRNASAAPGDNDAVYTFGAANTYHDAYTRQGLIYHREAFACVMADLVLPRGLWISERISNPKLGVSVRMLKDHQIVDDLSPARLDTAHGWEAIREHLACRACS